MLPKNNEELFLLTDKFGPYKFVWHDQFKFDEITVTLTDQLNTEENEDGIESHKGILSNTRNSTEIFTKLDNEKRYRNQLAPE